MGEEKKDQNITFNQQITGTNSSGNQIANNSGVIHTGDNNYASADTSPTAHIFVAVKDAVADRQWTELPDDVLQDPEIADVVSSYATPAAFVEAQQIEADRETVVASSPSYTPVDESVFEEQVTKEKSRWQSLAPWLLKGTVKVGKASLAAFAKSSPVIAGLQALLEFVDTSGTVS